jgi:NAD kinase
VSGADAKKPRVVIVTRKTGLEQLLERHGTAGQARFYVRSRQAAAPATASHSLTYEDQAQADERFHAALSRVMSDIPSDQRRTRVDRDELDRFLFAPDDIVVIVGQDGLVPNVAKYLSGQRVIGVNPDPKRWDGVLCRHEPDGAASAVAWADDVQGPSFKLESRTMALVEREDGQHLLALNEVFVGHRTHQSARYLLVAGSRSERQSSSGLICATGTGCTGWGRSIAQQRHLEKRLPSPSQPLLTWFVREPFPSVSSGTSLDFGQVERGASLVVHSEMGDGGTIFADGIETDRLEFLDGQLATIRLADSALSLVVPATPKGSASKGERPR